MRNSDLTVIRESFLGNGTHSTILLEKAHYYLTSK